MVIEKMLKEELNRIIEEYGLNSEETYEIARRIEEYLKSRDIKKNLKEKNYYEYSLNGLEQYMKENEKNPSEQRWNKYALEHGYLSAKVIGYLSGKGFNKLCKQKRKEQLQSE